MEFFFRDAIWKSLVIYYTSIVLRSFSIFLRYIILTESIFTEHCQFFLEDCVLTQCMFLDKKLLTSTFSSSTCFVVLFFMHEMVVFYFLLQLVLTWASLLLILFCACQCFHTTCSVLPWHVWAVKHVLIFLCAHLCALMMLLFW